MVSISGENPVTGSARAEGLGARMVIPTESKSLEVLLFEPVVVRLAVLFMGGLP